MDDWFYTVLVDFLIGGRLSESSVKIKVVFVNVFGEVYLLLKFSHYHRRAFTHIYYILLSTARLFSV